MTSTSSRRVLSTRSLQAHSLLSPKLPLRTSSASFKRPRSPDRDDPAAAQSKLKRARAISTSNLQSAPRDAKKEKQTDREQLRNEFKEKYSRAFPSWSFYFDFENLSLRQSVADVLSGRIEQLGGKVEGFFSKNITHLITDKPVPPPEETKENHPSKNSPYDLKSPFKFKSRAFEGDTTRNNEIVNKAASYGMKIWNATKLDSVICRCLDTPSAFNQPPPKPQASTRQLERLLTKEKTHGPSDRDPLQRRHDYRYFSKGSFFVLIEDLRDEVATIAAHEYPPTKEQKGKVPWPILYCHPQSRGPFVPFDEKEKARWERAQKAKNKVENVDRKEAVMRQTRRQAQLHVKAMGDLRRSVSLNNLHKRMVEQQGLDKQDVEPEGDVLDSANASGYLVSGTGPGYMAASGNSVGITSTTGTTSTASGSLLLHGQLPSAMDGMLKRQVLTSRKMASKSKVGNMDPPPTVPHRPLLKKSKSTNTLKLPKREEGSKPGYCESCRVKFDDFKLHVASSKHRRFAQNDSNFAQLDAILDRIRRRPLVEKEQAEIIRLANCQRRCRRTQMDLDDSARLLSETP